MPKTEVEWAQFWKRVWINLAHGLAALFVIVGSIWIGWWLFFGPPSSLRTAATIAHVEVPLASKPGHALLQSSTNSSLTTQERPCAVKRRGERVSDVKGCALLRLRLGMSVNEASQVLQTSGYFANTPALTNRCDPEKADCVFTHYIHQQRDGFSLTADFAPRQSKDKTLVLKQVTLWFAAGVHPYYDPEAVRSTFAKVLGPPDTSNVNGSDNWGGYSGPHIQGYTYGDRRYAIILRDSGNFGPQIDAGSGGNLFTPADGQRIDAINKFDALEEDIDDAYQEAKQGPDRNCLRKLKDEIRAAHKKVEGVARLVYKSAGMMAKADEAPVNEKLKSTIGEAIQALDTCPTSIQQLSGMCAGNALISTKGSDASKVCREAGTLLKEFAARLQ